MTTPAPPRMSALVRAGETVSEIVRSLRLGSGTRVRSEPLPLPGIDLPTIVDGYHHRAIGWLSRRLHLAAWFGDQKQLDAIAEALPAFKRWDEHDFKHIIRKAGLYARHRRMALDYVYGRGRHASDTEADASTTVAEYASDVITVASQ